MVYLIFIDIWDCNGYNNIEREWGESTVQRNDLCAQVGEKGKSKYDI